MKHFVVYALAAALIFAMIGRFAAAKSADPELAAPAQRTAVMAAQAPGEEAVPAGPVVVQVGLLQAEMTSMDDVYFRNALRDELGEGFDLHCLETPESAADQMTMFRMLVEKGYRIIVLELFEKDLAEDYIDLAAEEGLTLIFTGVQPPAEQLERLEDLYYVGASSGNTMRQLADAIIMGWENDQSNLDLKPDDRLVYGVFAREDYTQNGNEIALDSYLASAGIEAEMGYGAITQAYEFDLRHEVDEILYAGGEMIICDSSSYARQISNYLLDPTEFTEQLQKTRIYLTTADEGALQMVQEGTAMFAAGVSGSDLGRSAALLIQALARGEEPDGGSLGGEFSRGHFLYVESQAVTAELLEEQAPAEPEEDSGEG